MKNSIKTIIITLAILIVVGLGIASFTSKNINGNTVLTSEAKTTSINIAEKSGDVQEVALSVFGSSYVMSPSIFAKGVPVRIKPDISKLPGCSKSIVIPAFNIRKNLYSELDIIEFTPDKTGTFDIMCSMNMYAGKFTVVDSTSANVESPALVASAQKPNAESDLTAKAPSGYCNMDGNKPKTGGCGCGMMG